TRIFSPARRSRSQAQIHALGGSDRLLPLIANVGPSRVLSWTFALTVFILGRVKILFIGDIVGEPGRKVVTALVPVLRQRHGIDFIIANGENSAGGSGITPKTAEEIFGAGVDVITSGDHLWDQKEVMSLLAEEPRFLRPLNYPAGTVGKGSNIFRPDGLPPIGVLNLQGRVFMPDLDNPFIGAQTEVARLRKETKIIFVDMHAEATSEKIAMA